MKRNWWLATGLALLVILALWNVVSADGPPEDDLVQGNGRRVGLVSTEAKCLAVQAGVPGSASAAVHLQWEGEIEEAFLVLAVSGSRGGHSIYVNGRRVASAPVRPDGRPCQAGPCEWPGTRLALPLIPTHVIPIPAEVLLKGENLITLTNDADVNDGWTATSLHIEVHGVLSGPPAAALEAVPPARSGLSLSATAPVSGSVLLTSTYELSQGRVISQLVSYQIPASYTTSISVPLLIGIHGMGGSGQSMRDFLATEANNRGWLLAAPEMHGRFYVNFGSYALAWPGAQHDVLDTIQYMQARYEVDPSRIYITGGSMGGQTTAVVAAKYPDVFAAAAEWKGMTDLADWYNNEATDDIGLQIIMRNETGGTPGEVPFEYQRRSAMAMPQNSRLVPLRIWHDEEDLLVRPYHSYDLRDAINSWHPLVPVTLITVPTAGCTDPKKHCYIPDLVEVCDFLAGFALRPQPPPSVTIRTDESKPYYWLNVAQTGGDHWTQVQASYDLTDSTVTAVISDTQPLTLAFNLGSTPIVGKTIEQPGMGLPVTTYLIKGGGIYALANYSSGYLTTSLVTTGQFTLTVAALEAQVSANPAMVSDWQTATSTITAVFQDRLSNPAPDGTIVQFSASEGTFPNASSTLTTTVRGGQGQVTTTLTLTPAADLARVVASVGSITASTTVDVIHPGIDLLVRPDRTMIYAGQAVTCAYQVTNTGDITLTGVTVIDDPGTPGDSGDDLTVCADLTLAASAMTSCSRSVTLTQTTINTATVTGQDPLGHTVTDSDLAIVDVISPAADLLVTPHQTTICWGGAVTYTYQITNTGDITLTGATVSDNNGTPGDGRDDFIVCTFAILPIGATRSCRYTTILTCTTTRIATVSGQDPLGHEATSSDWATVTVRPLDMRIYLPIVTRNES